MFKIAALVSGRGSNLKSIIDAIKQSELNCEISIVISDRDSYALEIAKSEGIETMLLDRKAYGKKISDEINKILKDKVDLIVLAGFLSILEGDIIKEFKNRIINIHPSLIPSFCGPSMYGMKVHEAAINKGVKVSGCTVHFVDEETDNGPIILQNTVQVDFEDDAKSLAAKVLKEEHPSLVKAIKLISEGRVIVENNRVKILKK